MTWLILAKLALLELTALLMLARLSRWLRAKPKAARDLLKIHEWWPL